MPFDHETIKQASRAVDDVRSIDRVIEHVGREVQKKSDHIGDNVRRLIGQNIFNQFTNGHVGEVVCCAIINSLLDKRRRIVSENEAIVSFSAPPCPLQRPAKDQI